MKKSKNKGVKKSSNSKTKNKSSKNKPLNNNSKSKNIPSKINSFFKENKVFIIGSIIFLVLLLILILLAFQSNPTGKVTGYASQNTEPVDWAKTFNIKNSNNSNNRINNVFPTILRWIFGQPYKIEGVDDISVLILTIAVWLLVFLTFADIISTFSSFKKWISWVIGFLIAIIIAQFNFQVKFVLFLSRVFSMAASTAVFVGLGGAFFAFLVLNLGLFGKNGILAKWFLQRKMLIITNKAKLGANSASDAIQNLGKIEDSFKKVGESFSKNS